jgi:predicted secreted protein
MTKQEMIKPFSWGIVIGGVAVTIAAFSTGWVVTSNSRDQQVRTAWVDGQATICASLVQAHREAIGDVTDLKGYQARKARNELATTFAIALPGQEMADPSVIKACSGLLDKRNT